MPGCIWDGDTLTQNARKQVHSVIAHVVDLRVDSVRSPDGTSERFEIVEALSPSQDVTVDLRELPEDTPPIDNGDPEFNDVEDASTFLTGKDKDHVHEQSREVVPAHASLCFVA